MFTDQEAQDTLGKTKTEPSLLKLIDAWLSRTPGLVSYDVNESGNKVEYNYMCKEYEKSVRRYLIDTYVKPAEVGTIKIKHIQSLNILTRFFVRRKKTRMKRRSC